MKKIKGFTLIELIIVMAIMTILMAAIMQLMKPIRTTYLDATLYESQRNTQTGIAQYLTESMRYATNLGIYNEQHSSIGSVSDAISKFKTLSGVTDDSKIHVITIDNTTAYAYNNFTKFHGRLVRSKPPVSGGSYSGNNAADPSSSEARLALGAAYYDGFDYSISITPTGIGSFDISVSSLVSNSLSDRGTTLETIATGDEFVQTAAYVNCQNLQTPVNGKFDATYDIQSSSPTATTYYGTTTQGKNTYIVFTLPE